MDWKGIPIQSHTDSATTDKMRNTHIQDGIAPPCIAYTHIKLDNG